MNTLTQRSRTFARRVAAALALVALPVLMLILETAPTGPGWQG